MKTPPPAAFTLNTFGTLSSGSTTISAVGSLTGAADGMIVSGLGIPLGDRIAPGGVGTSTITLISAATATVASGQITIASGFRGIEISSSDTNATVTGTSIGSDCGTVSGSAVVQQDGIADPSTAVFANANASYTTLQSIYGSIIYSVTAFGTGSSTLSNQYHACVTVGALGPTINLPATPTIGMQYTVDDCSGGAATHHITIVPAAGLIDGSINYTISSNFGSWTGYYTGTRWKTIASCKALPC